MKSITVNGPDNLPIESIVETFGFGATSKEAHIVGPQRLDGTYPVQATDSTKAQTRIHAEDIVKVVRHGL